MWLVIFLVLTGLASFISPWFLIWFGIYSIYGLIILLCKFYLSRPYTKEHLERENKIRASLNMPLVGETKARPIVGSEEYNNRYMPKI